MALRPTQKLFRLFVRLCSKAFYRIRVFGHENVPTEGGVLLVPNHVSWLDGFLVMMVTRRHVRPIVHTVNLQSRWLQKWADRWSAIVVSGGPKSIRRALDTAHEALQQGDVVCIFPEGGITRTGQVQAFRPGLVKIVEGTGAAVVPVYLDELWGSIFSFAGGKFFWKWPRKWRYPISIHYGQPMYHIRDAQQVRLAVQELGMRAVKERNRPHLSLTRSAVRMCKKRRFASKIADSSGADLTGGNLLLRALILRRLLRRHGLASDEQFVGVLLPPSTVGVIANLALALDRRVPINLNYTVSSDVMNQCIASAGIRRVLTSRQVMSKLNVQLDAEVVELELYKDKVRTSDKISGALGAFVTPSWMLSLSLGLFRIQPSDEATVIFTSGSTGTPKGVVLTYDNIASNVEAIDTVINLRPADVVIGILPFFHSFGYTVTLWTPLAVDVKAVYHYSPLDGKRIGQLAKKHAATVLLATPTFLRSYLKRCKPDQFRTLDTVVAGAERLPPQLSDAFEEKFGVRPVEGYGCTELSPLVSVNVPPSRSAGHDQGCRKEGSVGRTVPGVAAKTVDLDTGEDLPAGREGMLLIKGPNVMKEYLHQPQKTAAVVRDGWYKTGDLSIIDDDGFIHITGRESRFSKIGGEMVPHIRIEEALAEAIGIDDDRGLQAVVTAVPDEKKGERLVVLHTKIDKSPEELCDGLTAAGLPNLFIPSLDSFVEVPELPFLGTGKLDLKAVKQLALEETAKSS